MKASAHQRNEMTQWTWRQNAACCIGALRKGDESSELFAKPWRGRASPLFWRVPILLWSLLIIGWSGAGFWGPPEMFFLYMTHWGLLLIMVESLFGVIVTIRKHNGGLPGHTAPSDFYVSCWQSSRRSAVPLLSLRCFLFLYSLSTLVTSMVLMPVTFNVSVGFWFIYVTHWSFLLIVLTMGSSIAVSACVYFDEPIDATFGLPWYVKTYWVLYNITIPVAFLITVFYWGILKTSGRMVNYAPNPVLDVMLHGANSLVMLTELLASAHPSRLLHIMQPLYFALAYLLFSVGYYSVGGLDPWGNPFIYPVIDWSKPQQTMVVVTLTALFLALMHILTVGIAALRDMIARKYFRDSTGVYNDGFKA